MASCCNAAQSRRSIGAWVRILAKALGHAGIAVPAIAAILACQNAAWAAPDDDYRLSVGDVVSFDFIDDSLPAEQLTVASDGAVALRGAECEGVEAQRGRHAVQVLPDGVRAAARVVGRRHERLRMATARERRVAQPARRRRPEP